MSDEQDELAKVEREIDRLGERIANAYRRHNFFGAFVAEQEEAKAKARHRALTSHRWRQEESLRQAYRIEAALAAEGGSE